MIVLFFLVLALLGILGLFWEGLGKPESDNDSGKNRGYPFAH